MDCGATVSTEMSESRRKLRPIACAEALVKLVEGIEITIQIKQVLGSLEPHQVGCGTPDAAPLLVYLARSWEEDLRRRWRDADFDAQNDLEEEVIAGIVLENAYGRAKRSVCLRGCRARAPRLSVLAATQWMIGGTTVWQRAGGVWRASVAQRGGWQGARLMQLMFAFGMEECFAKVPALNNGPACSRVALQDDSYLIGRAGVIADHWQELKDALELGGHTLREPKCKAWSPLCDLRDDDSELLPPNLLRLHELIPRSRGGLVLLGGAAQGEMETAVGDCTLLLQKATVRAKAAVELADRVRCFVTAQPSTTASHLGWFVLSKSVAFALSYDARLVPSAFHGASRCCRAGGPQTG